MRFIDRRRGSALITTMIIAGSVGLILAGIVRFAVVQLQTASGLEDGTLAYAAAEAGIEEGLLRWRYDRNVELPVVNNQETIPNTPVERVDLTTGATPSVVALGTLLPPATDSAYDLRIWYKAPKIGDATKLSDPNYEYRINKDQTAQVDVSNLRGEILQLDYAVPAGDQARVEVSLVTQNGCPAVAGVTPDLCEVSKQLSDMATGGTLLIPIPAGLDQNPFRVRIKPFIFKAGTATAAEPTSYITYALKPTKSASSLIDSGTTIIESTGYYGNAKRKLVAKINRLSGTILGIYDYAVYCGGVQTTDPDCLAVPTASSTPTP